MQTEMCFQVLAVLLFCLVEYAMGQCPAGHQWQPSGPPFFEACPPDSFSLQDWGRCCSLEQANACKGQSIDQHCACSPMICPAGQEPQRGHPGTFVCIETPAECRTASSPCDSFMFRERHSCNCLRLHPQTVVWGNQGGDYFEIVLHSKKYAT